MLARELDSGEEQMGRLLAQMRTASPAKAEASRRQMPGLFEVREASG